MFERNKWRIFVQRDGSKKTVERTYEKDNE